MSQRRLDIRSRALAAFGLLALAAGLGACSSLTDPPPPPAGGVTITLDYDEFVANVEPVLVAKGCDADGDCHGGGLRGTLALSPPTAKDLRFDYDQVVLQVSPTQRED